MTTTIGVINQKGGVGKTTTVINLSSRFAELGKRVLVFDLDPQSNLSTVLSGGKYDFDLTVTDLFDKPKRIDINATIIPCMANGEIIPNLYLVPADISLSRIIEQSLTQIHRERILMRHLEKLQGQFDIILLDCPPNLSLTSTNAMMAADMFLIPVDGGSFSLNGLADLLDALEEVKETEHVPYFAFRNERAKQNKLINDFLDEQLAALNDRVGKEGPGGVLESCVRREESIGQASVTSVPLRFYRPGALAVMDYKNLATEVLQKINELQR
ncbi:chromosome partitioning protein ParA [Aeromonas salmonicida subsp. salmonicida]|uniref:Partitioning protein ParA n=3 Tax=Aeromonas salmonicida subsp. salmonicida TaxID=29491 RepID=A0A1Q4MD40_AERSS|nr:ParA family protein [Aeromonas salmonicida]ABO92589.1 ParA family protein [Aeromonas salmonicida subsp. salmonicida A449]ASD49311.1 partitioning protein ParA [Aeromonas salmonicida subsp. salmonicida]EHI50303.1 ParA family protein [Aeromonas salmonicida subsp. salmonicida 01-B526]EKP0241286.1 ParA family protein [Aeromonas salmonicida]EKP0245430.1 ParA family protein [Aeromonas salmonicida]